MDKKSRSLTAAELYESLQHETLTATFPITLTGMVKKSDGKEKTVQFAPAGNCSGWVTIPLELIEDVEILKAVPCKDHTHPLVRLNLKTPTNTEAKIFSSILNAMQSNFDGTPPPFAGRQLAFAERLPLDPWGDPECGPGTVKRCYPSVCPNPSGRGTHLCTVCRCEVPFNPNPEGFASYYPY
jgi:hypothetical protein